MTIGFTHQYRTFSSLIIVISLGLAGLSYTLLNQKSDVLARDKIDAVLTSITLDIVTSMQQYAEKLQAIASIVTFSESVTPEQFTRYVDVFRDQDETWLIIEWQPIIAGKDRLQFEQKIRNTMYPDFQLWEPDANHVPIPAKQRDEHTPVLFMVTQNASANTIGLDLNWSEQRMQSKWQARDEGKAQLSPFFEVVLSSSIKDSPLGFALTLPVFKGGVTPQSLELRRQNIAGYIAGVYPLERFVAPILASHLAPGIQFEVRNTGQDSKHVTYPQRTMETDASHYQTKQKNVTVFGQDWLIRLTATEEFKASQQQPYGMVLPISILLAGALLLVFVHILFRKNLSLWATQTELETVLKQVRQSEQYFAELSRMDPLTSLMNRRAFFERIESELLRTKRYDIGLGLLIVDVDNFKRINDEYGHPTGDKVLISLTQRFTQVSRDSDFVCRFGGEEFAFLLINTSDQDALEFARRLCKSVAESPIEINHPVLSLPVTISVGATTYTEGDTVSEMLARADKALYLCKGKGRNQAQIVIKGSKAD